MASSPITIHLSTRDKVGLKRLCRPSAQHRQRQRAMIVLAAARGQPNQRIADDMGVSRETVRKWRTRYALQGLAGLADLPRPGRPAMFTPVQVAQIKAIACTCPVEDKTIPLARWSVPEIARQAVRENIAEQVSRTTIARWLANDTIKPWQTRSWISPRDPDFAVKGGVVLDLYQRIWAGQPLSDDEYVISTDEKPGIQALHRQTSSRSLMPGGLRRIEFDYRREGTLAYLAALDVGDGHIMGITAPTTGIAPFTRLVDLVMSQEPYRSAERVFWIADNGSSHRGWWAQNRLQTAWPNTILVHTPVHASWLNQIEVFFSILSRKALHGQSFNTIDALADRITDYQTWYNQQAKPFHWTWTSDRLHDYLRHLNEPTRTPTN